jgi:hypothetical protein
MNVLAVLPDRTLVYPGKDFKGWSLSTIGEEKQFNPYLNTGSLEQFLALKQVQRPADIQPMLAYDEDETAVAAGGSTTTAEKASAIVKAAAQAAATRELEVGNDRQETPEPAEFTLVAPAAEKIEAEEPEPPEMVIEQTIMDSEYAMPNDPFSGRDYARPRRKKKPDKPAEVVSVPSWR